MERLANGAVVKLMGPEGDLLVLDGDGRQIEVLPATLLQQVYRLRGIFP